jgi:endonuclease/exonuclease/phosphatase (EEP) superfamily protein YafD
LTPHLAQALAPLHSAYGFREGVLHQGGRGIALWSRLPWDKVEVMHFVSDVSPSVAATFAGAKHSWTLIGVHAPWPNGSELSENRNQEFRALARFAAERSGNVVVLGDLNCTSWSAHFGELLQTGDLRDGRLGFGLRPTWPVAFWPLAISIDHCLVSRNLSVIRHEVGPDIGSDHYPLVVEFSEKRP